MAQVRFVSWNIENYGQGISAHKRGPAMVRLNRFIAALVNRHNVDILGIMEVQPNSVAALNNLLVQICASTHNNRWCYDVVKGCVINGVAPGEGNIAGNASLDWQSGQFAPRREGYAFFWNSNHPDFTMLGARINMSQGAIRIVGTPAPPGHVASLTLRCRQTAVRVTSPYVRAHGGINPPLGVLGNWEDSYFPESSTYYANHLYYQQTRRPAYVIIELANGAGDQADLVPLMIYHAPAAAIPSKSGTFMGGMSQELYAIHTRNAAGAWQAGLQGQDNAVTAGDYNVRVADPGSWTNVYRPYYNNFGGTQTAGAEMVPLYNNAAPEGTVVQTNSGFANFGPPINSANPNDFYRAPIDEMFYRLPHHNMIHSFERILVPELIGHGQLMAGVPVSIFANSINWAILNHDAATGPINNNTGPLSGPGNQWYGLLSAAILNDWVDFRTGINQGWMPDARSAALFYRTFISDHLPLLIDFDV